ncbi:Mmp37-domain-containing protein, partial [Rhizopogon vinicolor AM-OR11-026]
VRTLASARRLPFLARSLTTDSIAANQTILPPLPLSKPETSKPRQSCLYPRPHPAIPYHRQALPTLPPTFGQNQVLRIPDSTRALLEDIVGSFEAPIRYAFAYGSSVFDQGVYEKQKGNNDDRPILDFIFAVTHSDHWHSTNMQQHPGHYPLHAHVLGSLFVFQGARAEPWTVVQCICADERGYHQIRSDYRRHAMCRPAQLAHALSCGDDAQAFTDHQGRCTRPTDSAGQPHLRTSYRPSHNTSCLRSFSPTPYQRYRTLLISAASH